MRVYLVSKSNDRRGWNIAKLREGVSATVWDHINGAKYRTATEAREAAARLFGASAWQRTTGRGTATYRGFVNN